MKKRKQGDYKIPFTREGDLMGYETDEYLSGRNYNKETGYVEIYQGQVDGEEVYNPTNIKDLTNFQQIKNYNEGNSCSIWLNADWRENVPFEAILTYIGYSRGRSAADLEFQDDAGHKFQMFMSNFNELLLNTNIINRKTELIRWNFCKKGSNYGLQYLERVKNE